MVLKGRPKKQSKDKKEILCARGIHEYSIVRR